MVAYPKFYTKDVRDEAASAKAGHLITRTEFWVNLVTDEKTVTPLREADFVATARQIVKGFEQEVGLSAEQEHEFRHWQRMLEAFEQFKTDQSDDVVLGGTSLRAWPQMTNKELCDEAWRLGLRTVEDLAHATDERIQKLGPEGRRLQIKAKSYLEASIQGQAAEQLEAQSKQIAELQAQLAELAAASKASSETEASPAKRGPGRPRKDAEAA